MNKDICGDLFLLISWLFTEKYAGNSTGKLGKEKTWIKRSNNINKSVLQQICTWKRKLYMSGIPQVTQDVFFLRVDTGKHR